MVREQYISTGTVDYKSVIFPASSLTDDNSGVLMDYLAKAKNWNCLSVTVNKIREFVNL